MEATQMAATAKMVFNVFIMVGFSSENKNN